MKTIIKQVNQIKAKTQQAGLSTRQVYQAVGIGRSWFMKMWANGFDNPNPDWMNRINKYLDEIIKVQAKYK